MTQCNEKKTVEVKETTFQIRDTQIWKWLKFLNLKKNLPKESWGSQVTSGLEIQKTTCDTTHITHVASHHMTSHLTSVTSPLYRHTSHITNATHHISHHAHHITQHSEHTSHLTSQQITHHNATHITSHHISQWYPVTSEVNCPCGTCQVALQKLPRLMSHLTSLQCKKCQPTKL